MRRCPLRLLTAGALAASALLTSGGVAAPPAPTTLTGAVESVHWHGRGADAGHWLHRLRTGRGRVRLLLPAAVTRQTGGGEWVAPGSVVRLRGSMTRRGFRVRSGVLLRAPREAHDEGAASIARHGGVAAGTRSVAVLLVNFSDDTTQPATPAQVTGTMFTNPGSVAAYFNEQSFGQLTVTGAVYGWYTLPTSKAGCDFLGRMTSARNAAAAADVDLSQYTNVMVVHPYTSGCAWGGLAYYPGPGTWINGSPSLRVAAHELGHNLGVDHSRTLACTSGGAAVALSPACSVANEYGDPFDIMGASTTRHFNGPQKIELGWLQPANIVDVSATGTHTISPVSIGAAGPQVLRIPRGSESLIVDFRRPTGLFELFGGSDPAVNGVMVRLGNSPASTTQNSRLIDATPDTATWNDAALLPGQTLTDPVTGISIRTDAVTTGSAGVTVSFPADTHAPSTPSGLSLVSVSAGKDGSSRVKLAWSRSADDAGVQHYAVFRDGVFVANALDTTAGTGLAVAWDDTTAPQGRTSTYTVGAVDLAGNAGALSAPLAVSVPDATPPTGPTGLTATVGPGPAGSSTVNLAWQPGGDNVGVASYAVVEGSRTMASGPATSAGVVVASGFTYRFEAYAVDAAGNRSAPATLDVAVGRASPPRAVAPGAPGRLVVRVSGGRLRLSWVSPTTGAKAVTYRVFVNGRRVVTTPGRSVTRRIVVSRARTVRIEVAAVSRAGKQGATAKAAVTVAGVRRR